MNIDDLIERRDHIRRELSAKICLTLALLIGACVFAAGIVLLPFGMNNIPASFALSLMVVGIAAWARHLLMLHADLAKVDDQMYYSRQSAQSVSIVSH